MAFCSRCGRPIADGEICVCSRPKKTLNVNDVRQFTAKFKNKMGIGTPESNSMGVYERGRKIVPECIATNENEIPIKQYDLAILRTRHRPLFSGYLSARLSGNRFGVYSPR